MWLGFALVLGIASTRSSVPEKQKENHMKLLGNIVCIIRRNSATIEKTDDLNSKIC